MGNVEDAGGVGRGGCGDDGDDAVAGAGAGVEFARCAASRDETSLRTPSNALKMDVEPVDRAEEIAFCVDSRFLSSFSSWMPSVNRSERSEIALTLMSHGCLDEVAHL